MPKIQGKPSEKIITKSDNNINKGTSLFSRMFTRIFNSPNSPNSSSSQDNTKTIIKSCKYTYNQNFINRDDFILDTSAELNHNKILCLSDTPVLRKTQDKGTLPTNMRGNSIAIRIKEKISKSHANLDDVLIIQSDIFPFEQIPKEAKTYHLPNNKNEARIEYHNCDISSSELSLFKSQDLILSRNILCSCVEEKTCGGLKREDISIFFERVCQTLNHDNNYSMAIFTGNDLFIGASAKPEEYKKTKANIKSLCDEFNFNGYQAKYNENHISNPGILHYGYSVHIYKSEYIELIA